MLTVYGIKNCDTVKKALKWLDGEGIAYAFHDLRADGLTDQTATRWVEALGWESTLNRRSTTWRQLRAEDTHDLDALKAVRLLVRHPTLAKRPIFDKNGHIINGFSQDVRAWLILESIPYP